MVAGILLVLSGLTLLTLGADRFVVAAARLSRAWGMSPILIGALVLGVGTSAPEFLVSAVAAAGGGLDLAVGNVIGSNAANLSLVLGASVLVRPVFEQRRILKREGVLVVLAVVALAAVVWQGSFSRIEGAALFAGMAVAAYALVRWARRDAALGRFDPEIDEMLAGTSFTTRTELIIALTTLAAILGGAELLVRGARQLASELGVAEGFIGLTLVAIGTSLPELATAIAAARRNENGLVVGNLLGSNLFNSLAVAGGAGLIGPGPLSSDFRGTASVMVGIALLAGVFTATGDRLNRLEGSLLLLVYAVFVALSF